MRLLFLIETSVLIAVDGMFEEALNHVILGMFIVLVRTTKEKQC